MSIYAFFTCQEFQSRENAERKKENKSFVNIFNAELDQLLKNYFV